MTDDIFDDFDIDDEEDDVLFNMSLSEVDSIVPADDRWPIRYGVRTYLRVHREGYPYINAFPVGVASFCYAVVDTANDLVIPRLVLRGADVLHVASGVTDEESLISRYRAYMEAEIPAVLSAYRGECLDTQLPAVLQGSWRSYGPRFDPDRAFWVPRRDPFWPKAVGTSSVLSCLANGAYDVDGHNDIATPIGEDSFVYFTRMPNEDGSVDDDALHLGPLDAMLLNVENADALPSLLFREMHNDAERTLCITRSVAYIEHDTDDADDQ